MVTITHKVSNLFTVWATWNHAGAPYLLLSSFVISGTVVLGLRGMLAGVQALRVETLATPWALAFLQSAQEVRRQKHTVSVWCDSLLASGRPGGGGEVGVWVYSR